MKFTLTFGLSDPVFYESTLQAVDEKDRQEAKYLLYKWLKYGQFIDVEFDSETGTGKLVPIVKKEFDLSLEKSRPYIPGE